MPSVESEGLAQRPLLHVAKQIAAITQQTDVGSREPVNRLPVISHQEVSHVLSLECLE